MASSFFVVLLLCGVSPWLLVDVTESRGIRSVWTKRNGIRVWRRDPDEPSAPVFERMQYVVNVPENNQPGLVLINVRATGEVRYSISEQSTFYDPKLLSIDPETGDLSVIGSLDHEQNNLYLLKVLATDQLSGMFSEVTVIINVYDVNDNPPYVVMNAIDPSSDPEVTENVASGTFVAHVSVSDKDSGPFGHVEGCSIDSDFFDLQISYDNGISVEFIVVTTQPLDYEDRNQYVIELVCQDEGYPVLTTTLPITVNIIDVNDNMPLIIVNTLSSHTVPVVPEDAPFGTFVAYVSVSDADSGSNGLIKCGIDTSVFMLQYMDENEYMIVTGENLDYEMIATHDIELSCKDQGSPPLGSSYSFSVQVADVNDNSPIFLTLGYNVNIYEGSDIGSSVINVSAFDIDTGLNAEISYSLLDEPSLFEIDRHSGLITTKALLTKGTHRLFVKASDLGEPSLFATAEVIVNVI